MLALYIRLLNPVLKEECPRYPMKYILFIGFVSKLKSKTKSTYCLIGH